MLKKKSRILISVLCITGIILSLIYIAFFMNKKENNIKEYVIIEEGIESINSMYGEEIIKRGNYKNGDDYISIDDVENMLETLGLEDIKNVIRVKLGKADKISRENWYEILGFVSNANGMKKICDTKEINIYSIDKENKNIISDAGSYVYNLALDNLDDKCIEAMVRDNQIIFIKKVVNEVTFNNLLIIGSEKDNITVRLNGIERTFAVKGLKEKLEGIMCDLVVRDNKIMKMSLKRDSISGKVQAISENGIEVEGFGNVVLDEKYRVYSSYDSYKEQGIENVRVGDGNLRFIVANKKICGIFMDSIPSADNIRVLIKTTGYTALTHDYVTVSSKSPFYVIYFENDASDTPREKKDLYNSGDSITFNCDNDKLKVGRIKITAQDENGKIMLNSVSRNGNNPEYRGTIELGLNDGKIVVINELSLEQYLYAVVPSEMPSSYGIEALKVQAVCARSYAVSHMNNGTLSAYGAQVNDSTDYQVYNVTPENENSISAVKATYGQVLMYNGEIANTYFFATSCGSTTDSTVWGGSPLPYIKGKLLCDDDNNIDLSDNNTFNEFIKTEYDTYDKRSSWYRWNITMTQEQLSDSINGNIAKIYNNYPDNVLTWTSEGFVSRKLTNIGEVTDIYVEKRGIGGTIEELIIKGTTAVVKIIKQTSIRNLISPNGIAINKADGTSVDTFNALPSAYFTVEKNGNSYTFYGGGYGHGAGMSQTAVKSMIDKGMNYEEILKFFYDNVNIEFIYDNK